MTEEHVSDEVIGRLRDNLRAAGIRFTESDIEGVIEKGFLGRLAALNVVLERTPVTSVPDYLKAWGESDPVARAASGPSESQNVALPTRLGRKHDRIADIAPLIKSRLISPVELTEQALECIAARDGDLNAFQIVLTERARAAACQAEEEIAAGNYRGPLHGVPVAVKDLFDLAGTPTTAGSKILAGEIATSNAAAVERLDAAGAVIVGKTRMSEFAYSPGSNNAHYGTTRNPNNPAHDTGGSSSGSGAAVAAGMVWGALGSDTGGSIRMPAAQCGIVGLKPTFGLVSLHGAVTLSWSLDHLGPMTRGVADAAFMLDILAGPDPRDLRTRRLPPQQYALGIDRGVAGLRIGVLGDDGTSMPLATDEGLAAWRAGLHVLEEQGATLVSLDIPDIDALRLLNGALLAMEAATFHQPMLRTYLDDYGEFMRHRILAAFAYNPQALLRVQQARNVIRRRCDAIFDQVDLLSTPTMPGPAPLLGIPASTSFTGPFNILGWPAITVPVGLAPGNLPLGLQLAGRPWDDATVLRAAYAVEGKS